MFIDHNCLGIRMQQRILMTLRVPMFLIRKTWKDLTEVANLVEVAHHLLLQLANRLLIIY